MTWWRRIRPSERIKENHVTHPSLSFGARFLSAVLVAAGASAAEHRAMSLEESLTPYSGPVERGVDTTSITAPGTILGNGLVSFANTTGPLVTGPLTNNAIWNNGSAANTGNARIAGTQGAGQTYTINAGAVSNSSTTA